MILERIEPKKSTKVVVGAPGRPFKVAKGAFSARGRDIFTLPPLPQTKWHFFDRESVNVRFEGGAARCKRRDWSRKRALGDFEWTPRSAHCDFCGLLGLKPLYQFERSARD